jgi:hypothetical protein
VTLKQVSQAEPHDHPADSLNWESAKKLCTFLQENQYLVKGTDKNLGISVVTLKWYKTECLKHLTSAVFSELKTRDDIPFDIFNTLIHRLMSADSGWSKQERNFLSDAYALTEIPQFHGIPNIHNKPWGLCPIIPSHSWISSPTAKIVSLYLKLIYKHFPWIIQSTKEFVSLLDKITINHNQKVFLCTGDVTAMYTNINKDSARITLKSMVESLELTDGKVDVLLQAIDLANNHNFVEFDGRFFRQEKGLAMGTACSPDITNLYLGNGEHNRKIPFRKGILSYARYIDDIFMIVQADSEEDAHLLCPDHIGHLKLLWEVSNTRIHFLDVEVFKMPGAMKLQNCPCQKPLNHYSQIPWSSSHPKHVKKSALGGELARLAINSSYREDYWQTLSLEMYSDREAGQHMSSMLGFQSYWRNNGIIMVWKRNLPWIT